MNRNVSCRLLCRGEKFIEKSYTKKQIRSFENFIRAEYRIHWIMDNLPAATKVSYEGVDRYVRGYPIGFVDSAKVGGGLNKFRALPSSPWRDSPLPPSTPFPR